MRKFLENNWIVILVILLSGYFSFSLIGKKSAIPQIEDNTSTDVETLSPVTE